MQAGVTRLAEGYPGGMRSRTVRHLVLALATLAVAAALAAQAQAGTSTVAKIYEAFSYHGVVIPHAQSTVSGYCVASSSAAPRIDAWRCVEGTTTLDPCFSSEFANGVVCASPWKDTAIVITLTKPLPRPTSRAAPTLKQHPWAIQLANGADCIYAPQNTRVHGHRLTYACATAHLALWGLPNRKHRTWTILSAPTGSTRLTHHASILHAWM